MAATFMVGEFVVELALAGGSERILPWLARGHNARRFDRATGTLFILAGVALAGTRH